MAKATAFQGKLNSTIGRKLAESRTGRFNQSTLAQRVGLTRAAISAVEAGQQGVSVETLCKLARALELEPGSLLPDLAELRELEAAAHAEILDKVPVDDGRSADEIVDEFLKGA